MAHTATKEEGEGIAFMRFTLKCMRPAAVTDRLEAGDQKIMDATGHTSDRMVKPVDDRLATKKAEATK